MGKLDSNSNLCHLKSALFPIVLYFLKMDITVMVSRSRHWDGFGSARCLLAMDTCARKQQTWLEEKGEPGWGLTKLQPARQGLESYLSNIEVSHSTKMVRPLFLCLLNTNESWRWPADHSPGSWASPFFQGVLGVGASCLSHEGTHNSDRET